MKIVIFISFILPQLVFAAPALQCRQLFILEDPALNLKLPEEQLFDWEARANLPEMQKPTAPVEVSFSVVKGDDVVSTQISGREARGAEVSAFFQQASQVAWPHHPLNTDPTTPFFSAPVNGSWPMHYSGSRSLFFYVGSELFSLKAPTNTPHPNGPQQPTKAQLRDRVALSVVRSERIQNLDQSLEPSPYLRVLHDIAAFQEKSSGNGFVVRDLRPLQDGHYYLPGFSVPKAGASILNRAQRNGVTIKNFQEFWAVHYAEAVGRAKAELLLRYGLLLSSPNAQNILIQLDRSLLPTGKVFIRDIGDSKYFENVAYPLGLASAIRQDIADGVRPVALLNISTSTSFWKMDEAGIDASTLAHWESRHDRAFIEQVVTTLNLDPQKYATMGDIQNFFATDRARAIIEDLSRR